ncbi:hypothetical protein DFH06DRAFT_376156 [Mycena polygramma]|nr:hypothetical protein DFH06DRAFT_376156 [Mycena polygramma]
MASVDDLRTHLYELCSALKHHKEVIRDLENATREVQGQLNALLDPITRLPIELSSDIFLRCLPSTASSTSHTAPLLLVRICHSWREIAHSTPALWAAMCIESPSRRGSDKHFDSWLNYAQHLPLAVHPRNPARRGRCHGLGKATCTPLAESCARPALRRRAQKDHCAIC